MGPKLYLVYLAVIAFSFCAAVSLNPTGNYII